MKLAAIDLGSNSFRLEIARVEGERIITEGSWKETIRLAAGIDKDGNLTPEAQNRGLNALARIAEKIRGMPRNHIRAVGTQTLRAAKNSQEFIGDILAITAIDIKLSKIIDQFNTVYSAYVRGTINA